MKKIAAFVSFVSITALLSLLSGAPLFEGTCDKDALSYKVGEKIKFRVALADDGKPVTGRKIKYVMRGEDGKRFEGVQDSDKPVIVETSLDKPGFVHLQINVLDENGRPDRNFCRPYDGGAGADIEKLAQSVPEPDDFDAYWKQRVAEYSKAPIKADLKRVETTPDGKPVNPNFEVYEFSIPTIGDPARGYITYPKNAADKSLKIRANFQGYGWASPYPAMYGDAIGVSMCSHSVDIGKPKSYYDELKAGKLKGFAWEKTLDSPKDSYFDGMIMRDLAALRYAKSLPTWNGKDLEVNGGSMGAFQSFAMGALDGNVTKLNVAVPWMADLAGKYHGRFNGWLPEPLPNRLYFDTINFAKRVKCPVAIRAGLGDYVCPPSGEAALYNSITAPVSIEFVQDATHGFPKHKTAVYKRQK